jgi:hypothetical protein
MLGAASEISGMPKKEATNDTVFRAGITSVRAITAQPTTCGLSKEQALSRHYQRVFFLGRVLKAL